MAFYIRALSNRQKPPYWKLQFIQYGTHLSQSYKTKTPRKEWDIPKDRWSAFGLRPYMSIEQARIRVQQLNARKELIYQEKSRRQIFEQLRIEDTKFKAALPEVYKDEFEKRYINLRFADPLRQKRLMTQWRAVQRMLVEIPLDPFDWFDEAHRFYDYFCKKQVSMSYARKMLYLTNLWGFFLARKLGQQYSKVSMPTGLERNRLIQAYFEKCGGRSSSTSDPITPNQLKKAKTRMQPSDYNWLYLSIWLGLRPLEVDQLKDPKLFRIQVSPNEVPVLWVHQTKLLSVPPRYRWKLIPLYLREQKQVMAILRAGNFKRPLVKTVRRHFGEHTTLYGGRKGFTDLMMSKGQHLIDISQWMGHSSIERTWRSYKSRRITHFTPHSQKNTTNQST